MTRRQRRDGIDQVLEALLADQASHGEHDRIVGADAVLGAHTRARLGVRREPIGVDAVQQRFRAVVVGAERHRAVAQVSAAAGDTVGALEGASRRPSRQSVVLRKEDVRAMQADDKRQIARRRRGNRSARDRPVRMDQRRAVFAHDAAHHPDARHERERRRCVG